MFLLANAALTYIQTALFNACNALVRASTESREATLSYFGRVASLNVKRRGLQVCEKGENGLDLIVY